MDITKIEIEKVIEMDFIIRFLNAKGYGIDPENPDDVKRVFNIIVELVPFDNIEEKDNPPEPQPQKPVPPTGREFDGVFKELFGESFWGGIKKRNEERCEELKHPKPVPPENRKYDETCFAGFRETKD